MTAEAVAGPHYDARSVNSGISRGVLSFGFFGCNQLIGLGLRGVRFDSPESNCDVLDFFSFCGWLIGFRSLIYDVPVFKIGQFTIIKLMQGIDGNHR